MARLLVGVTMMYTTLPKGRAKTPASRSDAMILAVPLDA